MRAPRTSLVSGTFLYCQNNECGVYLGSLGENSCWICGWAKEPDHGPAEEAEIKDCAND